MFRFVGLIVVCCVVSSVVTVRCAFMCLIVIRLFGLFGIEHFCVRLRWSWFVIIVGLLGLLLLFCGIMLFGI